MASLFSFLLLSLPLAPPPPSLRRFPGPATAFRIVGFWERTSPSPAAGHLRRGPPTPVLVAQVSAGEGPRGGRAREDPV